MQADIRKHPRVHITLQFFLTLMRRLEKPTEKRLKILIVARSHSAHGTA
jgi:hypothetical protein